MLRFLILGGACLAACAALAQPGAGPGPDFHPRPLCVPVAVSGQAAAKPCPIPPPPHPGMAPLEEGSPCQCGALKGRVQNGPRPE